MEPATEEDVRAWYNRRHVSQGERAWRPADAYAVFLDQLEVTPGGKLLDVGCGTGYLLKEADRRGLTTTGVDISDEAVRIARSVSPRSRIERAVGETLPFEDSSFDYVCCIGVLEHLSDLDRGVREFTRVTKQGGKLCVVVPNKNYLVWKLRGAAGTEQQTVREVLFDLDGWRNLLTQTGLRVALITQDKWPMRRPIISGASNLPGMARNLVRKLVWVFMPLRYTYQFIFVLQKP
jgi:ubiquinone/menaquinone biosynthesis C-methylase UbiE